MEDVLTGAIDKAQKIADKQPNIYREATFEAALNYFLGALATSPLETHQPASSTPASPLTMQLNEFLASKKLNSHPDRIVAIACYQYRKGDGSITTKDVLDAYASARMKKPQNVHDVISTCIRRGYLVDTDRKEGVRAWLITPSGEAHVDTELSTPARA